MYRTTILSILFLLPCFSVFAQNQKQFQHSTVYYEELVGLANYIGTNFDNEWLKYTAFFSPLYTELNGNAEGVLLADPIDVHITGTETEVAVEEGYIGAFYFPKKIVLTTDSDQWSTDMENYSTFYPTIYHELWHRFQYVSGVYSPHHDYIDRNKWIIEGTAALAEFVMQSPYDRSWFRFISYIQSADRHRTSLLDSSYWAALFHYYMWETRGQTHYLQDLMRNFGIEKDSVDVARTMDLGSYWKDFTKRMWNQEPVERIKIDGKDFNWPGGDPIKPEVSSKLKCKARPGFADVLTVLPALSWKLIEIEIDQSLEYCSIYFNEFGENEDIIVHAFLEDSAGKVTYEDFSGQSRKRICLKAEKMCSNESPEDVKKVSLIVANTSVEKEHSETLGVGTLASDWMLHRVQLNENLQTKARGFLSLQFGTGGGMLVKGKNWWVRFPLQLFEGESWNALGYINERCLKKGFVKFRLTDEDGRWEEENKREVYTWQAEIVKQGGYINTPSKWWCDVERQALLGGALGGMAGAGASAKIFTELNTTEWPEWSAAGKMAKVMQGVLDLTVKEGQKKEITMYHQQAKDGEWELVVVIDGNVRAYYRAVYSSV